MKHPTFYNPANAEKWDYSPDEQALFEIALDTGSSNKIQPAIKDRKNVHLLVIDAQRDFVFPKGSLYVGGRSGTGAVDDMRRTAEFIYDNMSQITRITPTMDTHFPFQIFYPSMWIDDGGAPLQSYDIITANMEIMRLGASVGKARANPVVAGWLANGNYTWLQRQFEHYVKELAREGKYELIMWPKHCILGSDGHVLSGIFHEARMFHSYVRGIQSNVEVKGGNPLTENYSVLGPEVTNRFDGKPLGQKNARFVRTLVESDYVVIAGEAGSHCVASSTDDLLDEIQKQDPELAKKVYVVTDLMSAVTVPDGQGGFIMDFTPQMEEAFDRWEQAGMNLVKSTDAMDSWSGIEL